MRRKSLVGMVLALAMAVSMCACGNSDTGESGTGSSQGADIQQETGTSSDTSQDSVASGESGNSNEAQEAEVEKPATISWWSHDGLNDEDYVKEWDAKYEELTGIKLEHTQVANNEYTELLEVAFASGTEPNVFDVSCDQKVAYYASQGGIADLTDLIKNSDLYEKVDQSVWDAVSVNGRIYGVPKGQPSGIESYVRQDWLDRLNMPAPTNYEEFIEMLRAFRDSIDECTIPLTAPGLSSAMNLPEFYWDAEAGFTYVDGQWVDGMLQDNFAGAMQRLQDAYAEGLIDTEVITNTTSACRDKWYSGEIGVFAYWGGKWGDTLTNRLKENFPDAGVTGLEALDETYYRFSTSTLYCIDGRLSPEEVEQVFKYFLEYINDGSEGQILYYCGVEGLHYEVDANGNLVYKNMVSSPDDAFQSVWGTPWLYVAPFDEPEKMPQPSDIVTDTLAVLDRKSTYMPTTPVSDTLNIITSDLTLIRQEVIANIVMGKVTVEDGLASYRAQAEELGIEQVLKEMNGQ